MRTPLLASWLLVGIWLYTFTLSYPWAWAAEGSRRSLHRLTGDIALARGDLARAVTAYRHALAVDKTPDGWLALGDVYRQQGDLDAAEAAYRKAWRQEIDYIPANVRLGDLLRTQGRSEEARTAFAGRYVAEQAVIDWSWRQLQPAPVTHIQVGDGLDFGYISGVYPAERLQGSMVRWTDGHARFRLSPAHNTPPETALVRLRLAAPHPGRDSVPAQICSTADCLPVELTSTWRIVTLQLPLEKDIHLDIHSPTFTAADGREVGVLVDWVLVDGDRPDSRGE